MDLLQIIFHSFLAGKIKKKFDILCIKWHRSNTLQAFPATKECHFVLPSDMYSVVLILWLPTVWRSVSYETTHCSQGCSYAGYRISWHAYFCVQVSFIHYCTSSSDLSPHKHNIWAPYVHLFTILQHVLVLPSLGRKHKYINENYVLMFSAWRSLNGRTKTRYREVNKWSYSAQMLCLCGLKSLMTN
jgi:hypothetical protein